MSQAPAHPPSSPPSGPHSTSLRRVGGDSDLPVRFGKYTLIRKLATGGMAELFLALHKSVAGFEKLIVIKRILPQMNQDASFIDMFLHEARIAATLTHANIVHIFDVGEVDGQFYIAMEHVHGEDIRSIVRQMKIKQYAEFPLEHAITVTLGLCSGLAYAHEKRDLDGSPLNIVHRDISPQNVVVTFSGDVKIVDFGIAKSDQKMNIETRSGKLKGKIPYMSPEQARGEPIDARSDIFSAAVMLFELTTGKRLFKGKSEFETLKLICEREYPVPSQVRPEYPPGLEWIVQKGLAKDPDERFQSAREMQAALEDFVRNERIAASTIHLGRFMQTLFEEQLATQKEALMQGKQLADILARQPVSLPPGSEVDATSQFMFGSGGFPSTPAASRTVTRPGFRSGATWLWVGAAIAAIAFIGVALIVWRAKVNRETPVVANSPTRVQKTGSVSIQSEPAGASIWIDGELRSEVTPAEIRDLPLGHTIEVRVTHDGFEGAHKQVELTDDASSSDLAFELAKGTVTVTVTTSPTVAAPTVALDGKKQAGLRLSGVSSGEEHELRVSAPGFDDKTVRFLGAPNEHKKLAVKLERTTIRPATAKQPAKPQKPEAPKGRGKLNVGAKGGWCNVSIDGANKGATPVAGVELSSGPHRVVCTPPKGPPKSATVDVPIGGTARYRFDL